MTDEFGDIWPEPIVATTDSCPIPPRPNDWPGDFGEVFDD